METNLLPAPDVLSVHWLWFQILLVVTFTLHIILANLILGGSLLAIWNRFKKTETPVFSGKIPIFVALTINLGVPPLLFLQVLYGHLFYTSSVLMAVFWIAIIPILIFAYYGTYIYVKKADKAPLMATISLWTSTIFLLYIAFVFVINSTLTQLPEEWISYFQNKGGTFLLLNEPSIWPRFLHFIFASLAVAAIGKSVFIHFAKKLKPEDKKVAIQKNLKIAAVATLIQVFVGFWFWLSMPEAVWKIFMGGQLISTLFMVAGWIIAMAILYFSFTGKLVPTLVAIVLEVIVMVLIREFARNAYLKGIFHPSDLATQYQISPLLIFLIIFIVGLGLIYYMIQLSQKPKNSRL